MSPKEFALKLKIRKVYIKKMFSKTQRMNVKQLLLKKVGYRLQKILPGKILTFYIMYFYRLMKQTQQNLFLLKYRMATKL